MILHWGNRDRQVPGVSLSSQPSIVGETWNTGRGSVSKHTMDGIIRIILKVVLCFSLHTYVQPHIPHTQTHM